MNVYNPYVPWCDDDRPDIREPDVDRTPERSSRAERPGRDEHAFARDLTLPRGDDRELVEFRGQLYSLNGSESRALATVGVFRVVDIGDFDCHEQRSDAFHGDWRHLSEQGLLTHATITDREGSHQVVALTRQGKNLLHAYTATGSRSRQQAYYSEVVKPRELAHDARLYGLFKAEARQIEREGGRVTRVVLDYKLKREYQQFLNREDRPTGADVSHGILLKGDLAAMLAAASPKQEASEMRRQVTVGCGGGI